MSESSGKGPTYIYERTNDATPGDQRGSLNDV